MRTRIISLAIAVLAASALASPVAAAGTTRMVDDDGRASPGSCSGNGAAFKKIQNAVDASAAGDRVLVCPGTYRGRITIPGSKDGLTLRSVTHLGATIRSPQTSTNGAAIVTIAPGASDVRVAHFRVLHVANVQPTAGEDECGWAAGIRADGPDALVESNTVVATGPGTLSECALEQGIVVGSDAAGDATLRYNVIKDFRSTGILVGGAGSRMTAFRNILRFHHLEAESPFTAGSTRAATRARRLPAGGDTAGGIIVARGASASIRENTIASHPSHGPLSDNPGLNPYLTYGIFVESSEDDTTVRGNRVYRTGVGIYLSETLLAGGAGSVTTSGNLLLSNTNGIYLQSSGGTVTGNRAYGNGHGLVAGVSSSGNTFEGNEADGNDAWDCEDLTSGPDNTWTDNIGQNADPDEICDPEF